MAVILHMDSKDKTIKFKKLNVCLMALYYPAAVLVFVLCLVDKLSVMRYAVIIAGLFALNIIGFSYSFIKAVFLKMPLKLRIASLLTFLYALASAVPFLVYAILGAYRGIWLTYTLLCLFVLMVADFARNEYGFKFEKQLLIF